MKKKSVSRSGEFMRWNIQKSPDNPELVRYFVVVVSRYRGERLLAKLFNQIQDRGYYITPVRSMPPKKAKGEGLQVVLEIFDTPLAPREVDWHKLGMPEREDNQLYERKRGSVESYVRSTYSNIS